MSRLPKGYEMPVTKSKYAKINLGENKFRILSDPITGWVYFNHESKPVRKRDQSEIVLSDIWEWKYGKKDPDHFWTFIVWDYSQERVNILELSKKTILKAFSEYLADPDFSDPTSYDISIKKSWSWKETEYAFKVGKHSEIPAEAIEQLAETTIDLEMLFDYLWNPYKD